MAESLKPVGDAVLEFRLGRGAGGVWFFGADRKFMHKKQDKEKDKTFCDTVAGKWQQYQDE